MSGRYGNRRVGGRHSNRSYDGRTGSNLPTSKSNDEETNKNNNSLALPPQQDIIDNPDGVAATTGASSDAKRSMVSGRVRRIFQYFWLGLALEIWLRKKSQGRFTVWV